MGKKALLICVCQATCPSFQEMDVFQVANAIRREKLVDYVAVHPQLCARDGDRFLTALLSGGDTDRVYVAACDPDMQVKMFRDAFKAAGFAEENLVGVDVRNMTTEQVIAAIKDLIATAEREREAEE